MGRDPCPSVALLSASLTEAPRLRVLVNMPHDQPAQWERGEGRGRGEVRVLGGWFGWLGAGAGGEA